MFQHDSHTSKVAQTTNTYIEQLRRSVDELERRLVLQEMRTSREALVALTQIQESLDKIVRASREDFDGP